MIGRRAIIAAVGQGMLVAVGGVSAALGQPQRALRLRLGLLIESRPEADQQVYSGLVRALAEIGYASPDSLELFVRSADGMPERLPALAQELVNLNVDVIVAGGSFGLRAAAAATSTIPIVTSGAGDPVGMGLAQSLAKPGGNVTGISWQLPEIIRKLADFAVEVVPDIDRLAVLAGPAGGTSTQAYELVRATMRQRGVEARLHRVAGPDDVIQAFEMMVAERSRAIIIITSGVTLALRAQLDEQARKHRLPVFAANTEHEAVIAYGPNRAAMQRRTANFVDRILRGAKPADLPIEQATIYELIVNAKAARAIGLAVPPALLARADEVIE
jgi:putative ABC transport system substrate-binding protein